MNSLGEKSIDSFLRVTGGLSNNNATTAGDDNSRIESALKEGENIRLILRSNGHDFQRKENNADDSNQAYIVCLAHHVPSDQFILFVFNSTTMPCRLIRYDRDGKIIESDAIKNNLCWNTIDAAVLVAAVNKCHEGNSAYFGNMCTTGDGDDDYSAGECIRLVPRSGYHCHDEANENEEVDVDECKAIRELILTKLLYADREDNGVQFQHPDPNFLLPLSTSISKELKRWRDLRQYHLPPRSEWPGLPSQSEWEKEQDVMNNCRSKKKEDFDRIVQGRRAQVEKSCQHCQNSMEKMGSFLRTLLSEGDNPTTVASTSFLLGKEIVASLALLRQMQSTNPIDWIHFHDAFESIEQECHQSSSVNKRALVDWLEHRNIPEYCNTIIGGDNYHAYADSYGYQVGDGVDDVVGKLYMLWVLEEQALFEAFEYVVSTVEQCLTAGKDQSFESVFDCIKEGQDFVLSLQMKSKRATELNAARLVELTSDAEEELNEDFSWLMDASSPPWTNHNLQSHLSFGWCKFEREDSLGLSFLVDHDGLMACLRNQMDSLHNSSRSGTEHWGDTVDSIVDTKLKEIENLLAIGDLLNSSIAILCLLGVFCDGACLGRVVMKWPKHDIDENVNISQKFIIPKFQEMWRKCDALVIKVALAYFDSKCSRQQVGSQWFFNALKSGSVSSPNIISDIYSRVMDNEEIEFVDRLEICWTRYFHPAASIFIHHGWQHPIFLSLLDCSKNNEKDLLKSLRKLESSAVIKGRFNLMKKQGNNPVAIVLARVAGGDHECMHFLLANGLTSEAMVLASSCKNFDGLERLSKDLALINPCASVLCLQAHILGRIEENDSDSENSLFVVSRALDNVVDVLRKVWFTPTTIWEHDDQCDVRKVASLRLLATLSLARVFLLAAKSTSEMQAILEQQRLVQSAISPLLATIAISSRVTRQESRILLGTCLRYLLSKTEMLLVRVEKSQISFALTDFISGSLTDFRNVPEGFSRKNYLDFICFLYESAKFLIEEEGCRSVFCFTLALFSSVQIGVRTGCEVFALDVIGSLKKLEGDYFDFDKYTMSCPLSCLSACFSALFTSCGYDVCQDIQHSLLETFLQTKVKLPDTSYSIGSGIADDEDDVIHSQVWMAIAYSKHCGFEAAGATLSDHIFSHYKKVGDMIGEMLGMLKRIDKSPGDDEPTISASSIEKNTMHSFVNSDKRKRVTELERNKMIIAFISQTLGNAPLLGFYTIGDLYLLFTAIDPLGFNPGLDQVENRLSHISGMTLALSKKSCLMTTCTLMHYIDNPYMVLELGLSWLRNALSSQETLVLFDNSEPLIKVNHVYNLKGRPKRAAKVLIEKLYAKIMVIREEFPPSWLSDLCDEALVLSRVLEFLIEPTPERFGEFEKVWRSRHVPNVQFPSFLQPETLLSIVIDPQWSAEPDFSADHKSTHRLHDMPEAEEFSPVVPFLEDRVAIAVQYGHTEKASKLCTITMNDEFWTKLSDETTHIHESLNKRTSGVDSMLKFRQVLTACLNVINGAISRRVDLQGDFVNHALHFVLAMNWFRACKECSPDSPFVNEHARKFVVSLDHVRVVHEIAMAWGDVLDESKNPFGASLNHCLNVIRCVSQGVVILEGVDFKRRTDCSQCCAFRQDKDGSEEGTSCAPEEISRPIKRQKILGSSIDHFKELEAFAQKLAMKDATCWCKDAIRRVEGEESDDNETQQ